jgi:hypothetical protein
MTTGSQDSASRRLTKWWAEPPWTRASSGESVNRCVQIGHHPPRRVKEMMLMPVAVDLDLVTSSKQFLHQIGVDLDEGSHAEEGGDQVELVETIENQGRGFGTRSIIKGQRNEPVSGTPPPAEIGREGSYWYPLPQADDARHHMSGQAGANRAPDLVHAWPA